MTPAEITRELTYMREAGIGGVELQPVYPVAVDDPSRGIRNVRYFSEEWFDLLRHVARETARLGLQFDFTLGSGWPYGGPFIPIELAARRLRILHQEVSGPRHLSFESLAGKIVDGDNFICAVATPMLPSGEPDIAHSKVVARGARAGVLSFSHAGWEAAKGLWSLALLIDAPTRQQVKRPTIGMEGYVLDHFNRKALELFLEAVGQPTLTELQAAGAHPIHSVFCDSLEVYGADWTGATLDEFQRRRGYDLAPYLPALWQDAGPLTPHVRYDYHLTLSELILENFFKPLVEWSEAHHVTARLQAHGAMGDVMRAYGLAHIPEGESIFGGDRYLVDLKHRRLASSAGHVYNKRVISAETYTWLRQPLFLVTLEMMKAATDAMFLDGINQIVNHGYPSSPPAAGIPGWTFYASTVINHNNTWWPHYRYLAQYIRRAAALLREGVAVNPVAVYLPVADVYAKFGCGGLNLDEALERHMGLDLFLELRRAGYDFDALNDHALCEVARIEGDALIAGTAQYSVVIVPECKLMPPESAARLAEFVRSGGVLIFIGSWPQTAPGLTDQDARTARLKQILAELASFSRPSKTGVQRGKGTVVIAPSLTTALEQLHSLLPPDFDIIPAGKEKADGLQSARQDVGFLHRRVGNLECYFVSNISGDSRDLRVRFRSTGKVPQRWDPETGVIHETLVFAHVGSGKQEATEVSLSLDPFESCFVLFCPSREPPMITDTDWRGPLEISRASNAILVRGRVSEDREYWLAKSSGAIHRFSVRGLPDPVAVTGPWRLKFDDGRSLELSLLQPWADIPAGKGYSGWATYEASFNMNMLPVGVDWVLDLGSVHETAEAELNGVALGAAWKGARRLATKGAIREGKNEVRVRVANLWIHKVVSTPPRNMRRVVETYGARWGEPEIAVPRNLPPSGLLGPVRLTPLKNVTVSIPL